MRVEKNPWIPIADLLSSIVLVLLLLFVMAVIVPRFTQEAQKREAIVQLQNALYDYEVDGLVKLDMESGMLEFTDITFDQGSALLNDKSIPVIKEVASVLVANMDKNPQMQILIEGHTDPTVVTATVNKGGYFENNIQLSALRASNVRGYLLQSMGEGYVNRIGIAGYGETRLKNNVDKMASENRRVEVRMLWTE